MRKIRSTILAMVFTLLLLPNILQAAAGYRIGFQGGADNGVALAGEAAIARDAATALKNPAGMTLLDKSQFMFAMEPLAYWSFWEIDNEVTNFNGTSGGNTGACTSGMAGHIVYKICDKIAAGFTFFTPGAISANNGRDFKGRFFLQRQLFPTFSGNWSLAYQVTPKLSFGAGLTIGYGYLNSATALPDANFVSTLPNSSRIKFNLDNWKRVNLGKLAYGYDVGAIYQLTPCTRVGITYHSQLNFRLHGTTETITAFGGATYSSADVVYKLPQFVVVSLYHKYSSCLTLLANVGWDNWSILDKGIIKFKDGSTLTSVFNWHDTIHMALGAEYKRNDRLTLQGGVSWDSSPVTSNDRTVTLPYSNWLYLSTGAIYQLNCCETVGFTATYGVSLPRGRKVDEEYGNSGYRFKGKLKVDLAILSMWWNRKFG